MTHTCSAFRVLVADPPWKFGDQLPGKSRGAAKNYDVLSLPEICDFSLPTLEDDCVLFLWRVSAMVEEAYQVVRAWNFTPKSELVWLKRTSQGKRHFGMGHYVRAEHETCIIATRGKPVVRDRAIRSTFEGTMTAHSAKPAAFYELVEKLCEGPYVELFGRRMRRGWNVNGKEASKFPAYPASLRVAT